MLHTYIYRSTTLHITYLQHMRTNCHVSEMEVIQVFVQLACTTCKVNNVDRFNW